MSYELIFLTPTEAAGSTLCWIGSRHHDLRSNFLDGRVCQSRLRVLAAVPYSCPHGEDDENKGRNDQTRSDAICSAIRSIRLAWTCSFHVLSLCQSWLEYLVAFHAEVMLQNKHLVLKATVRLSDSPSSFRSSCPCPISFHVSSLPISESLSEGLFLQPLRCMSESCCSCMKHWFKGVSCFCSKNNTCFVQQLASG